MSDRVSSPVVRALIKRIASFEKGFYFFTRSPIATIGLGIVVFYALVAIFGPIILGGDPMKMLQVFYYKGTYIYNIPQPPSAYFPFGTTFEGYSIWDGVIKGARIDIGISTIIVLSAMLIGTVLGSIAGYKGGIIEEVIMRLADILLSIPYLILAIAFLAILGRNMTIMIVALIIAIWPRYTRIIRGQVLTIRELKYVEASVAAGSSSLRTVIRHVIPNSIYPAFVQISLDYGNIILTIANLFFLGVGFAGYYTPEWGNLIGLALLLGGGLPAITEYWWTTVIPAMAITIFVISVNLLGDGLRDILDPRMRR